MKNKQKKLPRFALSRLIKNVMTSLFSIFIISIVNANTASQTTPTANNNQNANTNNSSNNSQPTNTPFAVATLVPTPPPTIESLAKDVTDLKQRMNETEQNVAQSSNKVNKSTDELAKIVADIEQIKNNTSTLTQQSTNNVNVDAQSGIQNENSQQKTSSLSNNHLLPPDVDVTDKHITLENFAYKKRKLRHKRRMRRDNYFPPYAPPPPPPTYGYYPPYGSMPSYAPPYPAPYPTALQPYSPTPYTASLPQYQQPSPNQTPYVYAGHPQIVIPNHNVNVQNATPILPSPVISIPETQAPIIVQQATASPITPPVTHSTTTVQMTSDAAISPAIISPSLTHESAASTAQTPAASTAQTPAATTLPIGLLCGQGGSACDTGKTCFNQSTDATSPFIPCVGQNCTLNQSKCLAPTEISCGKDAGNSLFGSACANNQICAINAQACSISNQTACTATAQCTPLNQLKCGTSNPCDASQICAFNYQQCQDLQCMLNPFSFCVTPSVATCQVTGMCNYTTTHISSNTLKDPWYAGKGTIKDYDFGNIIGLAVWAPQKMILVSDTTSRGQDLKVNKQIKVIHPNGQFYSLPHIPGADSQPINDNKFTKLYVDKNYLYAHESQKLHIYDLSIIPTATLSAAGEYPSTGWVKAIDVSSNNPNMPFAVKNDKLYYADGQNLITPSGSYQHNALINALDVSFDGVVYFTDDKQGIYQYDSNTKKITSIKSPQANKGNLGDCQNFKDMDKVFSNITDIKLSTDELSLFVLDAGNNNIRKIALDPSAKSQQTSTTINRIMTIAGAPSQDSKCAIASQRVLYPYIANNNNSLSIMAPLDDKTLLYSRQGLNQSDNQPTGTNMAISTVIYQP